MADDMTDEIEPQGAPYRGPAAHDPEPAPHRNEDDPDYVNRTKFLSMIALAGGGVMGAALMVPVIGFAFADSLKAEDFRWVDIGPMSDFPDGEVQSLAVSGPAPESNRGVYVRNKDSEIIVMWSRCAHLGCPVGYNAGSDAFACPCHGGAYDAAGRVTAGPPPRPLDRFDWKIVDASGADVAANPASREPGAGDLSRVKDDDRLLIGRPYSIDDAGEPFKLRTPGYPVDGVISNLYPFN